jgi:tetratricopeptide (TPR) repeat protein
MSELSSEELVRAGGAALKAGERERARQLLAQAVRANPRSEQAWLFLAGAVSDPDQRRSCLERVLKLNPEHTIARKALGSLKSGAAPTAVAADPYEQPHPLDVAVARARVVEQREVAVEPPPVERSEPPPPFASGGGGTVAAQEGARSAPALALEPERTRLLPQAAETQRASSRLDAPAPNSMEAILAQLRAPVATGETMIAPPGLAAAAAEPAAAVGMATVPLALPQVSLPMELPVDEERRRRAARRLWIGVLILGVVLLVVGLGLALAVVLGA